MKLNRRTVLQATMAAALPLSLYGCSSKKEADAVGEEPLVVGGLPVTCNLTLPVACMASAMRAATSPGPIRTA